MNRRMFTTSRLAAGALILAFAVVSSATCLAAALDMPRAEQHACCAAMTAGCGSAPALDDECCAVSQPVLSAIQPFTPVTPTAVGSSLSLQPAAMPTVSVGCDPDVSYPVGPPTYLVDSVFRI